MKKIGIALSGGGHRASIFSLGALLYLVDSGRNVDVKTISSVSGGSITNAFLATMPDPFNDQNPEKFEKEAAKFAKKIAGSPKWWWATVVIYLIIFSIWLTLSLSNFPESISSPIQMIFIPIIFIWAAAFGPRSGGTFWAWWGTWFYCGILIPLICIALLLWWSSVPRLACLILTLIVGVLFYLRNLTADLAFKRTIRSLLKGGKNVEQEKNSHLTLSDIFSSVRHVFCATEVHHGKHAYFTHDLIYSPDVGLGVPANFKLSTAVQMSANFPVGFPFRVYPRWRKHHFLGDRPLDKNLNLITILFLALTDGGVYDNTGASWFLEKDSRSDKAHNWTDEDILDCYFLEKESEDNKRRFLQQAKAMQEDHDQLIVVNSSAQFFTSRKSLGLSMIPLLGEIAQILRYPDLFYSNQGYTQSLDLLQRFLKKRTLNEMQSAILSIGELPGLLAHWINDPMTYAKKLDIIYRMVDKIDDAIQARASQISKIFHFGFDIDKLENDYYENKENIEKRLKIAEAEFEQYSNISGRKDPIFLTKWRKLDEIKIQLKDLDSNFVTEKNRRRIANSKNKGGWELLQKSPYVPTTLRPLGCKKVTQLLYHGYSVAMSNASVMLDDFPLMKPLPKLNQFKALAEGNQRSYRPEPYYIKKNDDLPLC